MHAVLGLPLWVREETRQMHPTFIEVWPGHHVADRSKKAGAHCSDYHDSGLLSSLAGTDNETIILIRLPDSRATLKPLVELQARSFSLSSRGRAPEEPAGTNSAADPGPGAEASQEPPPLAPGQRVRARALSDEPTRDFEDFLRHAV